MEDNRISYTTPQLDDAIRVVRKPGHLALQLPESEAPIVTSVPIVATEYKVGGADKLIAPAMQDFTYISGPDHFAYIKAGAVDVPFNMILTQSFSQTIQQPNAELSVRLRKNGTSIIGVYSKRTIRTSDTIGVIAISGHFTLSTNDYLELVVQSDTIGNFNAWAFSASLIEEIQ
jgi:hypothetical protein